MITTPNIGRYAYTKSCSLENVLHESCQILGMQLLVGLEHVRLRPHHAAHLAVLNITHVHSLVLIQRDGFPESGEGGEGRGEGRGREGEGEVGGGKGEGEGGQQCIII